MQVKTVEGDRCDASALGAKTTPGVGGSHPSKLKIGENSSHCIALISSNSFLYSKDSAGDVGLSGLTILFLLFELAGVFISYCFH